MSRWGMPQRGALVIALALWASSAPAHGAAASAVVPAAAGDVTQPVQATDPSPEVVVEIRIHGNWATPDAEVVRIAGLATGQALGRRTLDEVARRLRDSGRFDEVEIRKRYRSMESSTDVVLVIIVQEHPTTDEVSLAPPNPFKRMVGSMQVLPVLNYVDGYGFTYGGRLTFAGALGRSSRISVPLTWGGTKQAAAVLYLDDYLPTYYEVVACINAEKPIAGWKANAYVIFDYFSPTDAA